MAIVRKTLINIVNRSANFEHLALKFKAIDTKENSENFIVRLLFHGLSILLGDIVMLSFLGVNPSKIHAT